MRAGICSIQQALTVEAAAMVKQAVTLAKRRGHAQVTPLHVASSMLASSTGLLRRACLSSHSHPLQCKALELCFNVALNRLPSSTPGPLLGLHSASHHHHPALSNALVAAFKRAQAHQRRGSMENQQQPILALKIEVEQLIISILDDPSVSRVMREAGFSSPQVKSRVEQAVSIEICSPPPPPKEIVIAAKPLSIVSMPYAHNHASNDDVTSVVEALVSKKRNVVVIGEGISSAEGVVRGIMDRFEKGMVPTGLRSVQFISLPLFALRNLSREEVEAKLAEVRNLVKNCIGFGRGVVFYLGDLQGVSDFWSSYVEQRRGNYFYCSMEHIVMEMKKMACGGAAEIKRVWLMGVATYRTYLKCKSGYPSLESLWDLHPLPIPAGSLSLSLNLDSNLQDEDKSKILVDSDKNPTVGTSVVSSSLPLWLQQYKNETLSKNNKEDYSGNVKNLKKWNSFCNRAQNEPHEKPLKFYSTPSSPTTSFSSPERSSWPAIIEFKESPKEHQFWVSKPDLLSNPNSSPNSASSSEVAEDINDADPTFNEFSAENFRALTDALESKVPWQGEVILEISSTILECRSGIGKKPRNRKETWMFFIGLDSDGKEKISRELAKLIFGSHLNFASIGVSRLSDKPEGSGNKRKMENEHGVGYLQRFAEAVNENPHRVFVLEEIDQVDYCDQVGIKTAIETGELEVSSGEIVSLRDAIIVLSCESFGGVVKRARSGSLQKDQDVEDDVAEVTKLDLNMAVEDDKEDIDGVGILELVDKKVVFKLRETRT